MGEQCECLDRPQLNIGIVSDGDDLHEIYYHVSASNNSNDVVMDSSDNAYGEFGVWCIFISS